MNEYLKIRPYQLMCIFCKSAGGFENTKSDRKLKRIFDKIRRDPDIPLTLVCNVSCNYSYQNPGAEDDTPEGNLYNIKRDLDILQKTGLVPGTTMPARFLMEKLLESVESEEKICVGNRSGIWRGCKRSKKGAYKKARTRGLAAIIPERRSSECAKEKKISVKKMYNAEMLLIRPHHLMCMVCFSAGPSAGEPIEADNLYEAVEIIRKKPDIPVKLVEGPCMICPPCKVFLPDRKICIGNHSMGLRDEKKDLDVLQKIDMKYGDIMGARELYSKLFAAVKSTKEICGFGDGVVRSPEWKGCGMKGRREYVKARKKGMKIPGLKVRC